MEKQIEIIGLREVMAYGFGRETARALLNVRGCPVLPRVKGGTYRIDRRAFEEWLASLGKAGGRK